MQWSDLSVLDQNKIINVVEFVASDLPGLSASNNGEMPTIREIILVGSFVHDLANAYSDVDVLLVSNEKTEITFGLGSKSLNRRFLQNLINYSRMSAQISENLVRPVSIRWVPINEAWDWADGRAFGISLRTKVLYQSARDLQAKMDLG